MTGVKWFLFASLLVSAAFLCASCKHDNHDEGDTLPAGLQFVFGDTLYIIPDSAVAYAGTRNAPNKFDVRAYKWAEYSVAIDTLRARIPYHGDFAMWQTMSWNDRYPYLPAPFTHDIMTDSLASFYFMIGTYLGQFGFGWQDTYNGGAGWTGSADWNHPVSGLAADNPLTVNFDGGSTMFYRYRAMMIKRLR